MASITKHEQQQQMLRQAVEQEQLLGYWAKSKGITRADLEQHPHIDDVILMIRYRESMWLKLNKAEQAVWGAYWGVVYNDKKALSSKALKKLEQITITATHRHLRNLVRTTTQRQLIKARRQNPNEKSADDIVAKTADTGQSPPWD